MEGEREGGRERVSALSQSGGQNTMNHGIYGIVIGFECDACICIRIWLAITGQSLLTAMIVMLPSRPLLLPLSPPSSALLSVTQTRKTDSQTRQDNLHPRR